MRLLDKITPENIRQLVPYSSAKRELFNTEVSQQSIWLNANESPYNNADSATALNRYPDFQSAELINRYADYAGVKPDQVLVTRGADEGIELLVRTFCTPGQDSILINPPTYGMYTICATTFNVKTIKVPLTNEYQLDVEQIINPPIKQSKTPKLVFICSPNNPTGELIGEQQIIAVLDAYKDSALVVVDEAYIEFCVKSSVAKLINQYPNLVILRTLSKAFALAGIRCGFTLAHSDTIAMLQKVIAPYPIAAPVEQIALQALSDEGIALMQQQVDILDQQKQNFIKQLTAFEQVEKVISSDTNFVLLRVADKQQLLDGMKKRNILIRDQSSQPTLANCVRITIGNPVEMQAVINVFKET